MKLGDNVLLKRMTSPADASLNMGVDAAVKG
jgi:hypothetical protein